MKAGTPSRPSSPAAAQRSSIASSMASPTIDQRLHLALSRIRARMGEHLADLGMAAAAVDPLHQRAEPFRLRHPAGGAAFGEPAIIDELDVEPADRGGFLEHLAPAAGRRRPRSAAGSWWRRAQRSAGRAGRARRGGIERTLARNASISGCAETGGRRVALEPRSRGRSLLIAVWQLHRPYRCPDRARARAMSAAANRSTTASDGRRGGSGRRPVSLNPADPGLPAACARN